MLANWTFERIDERTIHVVCPTFSTPLELSLNSIDRKILAFYSLASELMAVENQAPWQTMQTAPKDGTAIVVLMEGSDVPYSVRWDQVVNGWRMTWDGYALSRHDGPRYWMHVPDAPAAASKFPAQGTPP